MPSDEGEIMGSTIKSNCRHCDKFKYTYRRGICWRCYAKPEVRVRYEARVKQSKDDTLTEAELDAMIAEQMKPENLPETWEEDVRRNGLRDRQGRAAIPIRLVR